MRGQNGRTGTLTDVIGISYDKKTKKTLFENECEFSKEISAPTINADEIKIGGIGITNVYAYKGVVATTANLPLSANAGDCYNVLADGYIYAYNGEEWQRAGSAMVPQLPSDAASKIYTLRAINGYLQWVEETITN